MHKIVCIYKVCAFSRKGSIAFIGSSERSVNQKKLKACSLNDLKDLLEHYNTLIRWLLSSGHRMPSSMLYSFDKSEN